VAGGGSPPRAVSEVTLSIYEKSNYLCEWSEVTFSPEKIIYEKSNYIEILSGMAQIKI
jgi:hypothetical protein